MKNLIFVSILALFCGCATMPKIEMIGMDAAGKKSSGIVRVAQNNGVTNFEIESVAKQYCGGPVEFTMKKSGQYMASNWWEWRMYETSEITFNCQK